MQSQLASAPDSGTLLGDEALDGSGSGDRPIWNKKNKDEDIDNDDEDVRGYDHDDEEASGSGMGPTTPGKNFDSKFSTPPPPSFFRIEFGRKTIELYNFNLVSFIK